MDKTFNDAYIDYSILETSYTLPKTPAKRIIDEHILLFLELGVVLFKSSHYFNISNFLYRGYTVFVHDFLFRENRHLKKITLSLRLKLVSNLYAD